MGKIVKKYDLDADKMFAKIIEACIVMKLKIDKEDAINRRLLVSTGLSIWSWGEKMDIIASQQKDGSTVTIDYSPRDPINLTAINQAKGKAEALIKELDK